MSKQKKLEELQAAITAPTIEREELEWGVRLLLKPFKDSMQPVNMEIEAEISKPRPGRTALVQFRFTGASVHSSLKITDMVIWSNGLREVMTRAREIAAEMRAAAKQPETKPKKKKA